MATTKHFLDTSVLRAWLLGPEIHRNYFSSEFSEDKCYVSRFIIMEFLRSFVLIAVEFCLLADMPHIDSISDAISFWSNKYKGSEHTAVEQLIGSITRVQNFDLGNPNEKRNIISMFALYIERIVLRIETSFSDTGTNSTRCVRSAVGFEVDTSSIMKSLKEFADSFRNTEDFAKRCKIYDFITARFKEQIELYITNSVELPKNNANTGFIEICNNLKKIIGNDASKCNCRLCGNIGDAIIALDAPRDMTLEHTDRSFNHLCPPIQQPHKEHPSAIALQNSHMVS